MGAVQNIQTPQTDLRVGRRIHCILHGGRNGTISRVHGEPGLGNSTPLLGGVGHMVRGPEAHIDVIWDNGGASFQTPECIATGVQWRFLDEPDFSQADIDKALAYADQIAAERDAEKKAAADAFDAAVAAYRSDKTLAHYEQTDPAGGWQDRTKLAAKNIRKLLKKDFPGVKFSVRKDGHDCVWVTWPTADHGETVNQRVMHDALAQFRTGTYDLHSDCHGSSNSAFNIVFGGVTYMTCQQSF
jgi:hypothetical protein